MSLLARIADLPRRRLALLPAPLTAAPALGAAIGVPRLWVKHDELLGFGFGGNKVRGLELLVADAVARGADVLVTGAGPQSNHVRASAAAAAHAGLALVAVYWGDEPRAAAGNHALTLLLGARCRFTGDPDRQSVDRGIEAAAAELRAAGRRPYPIPRDGACRLGVLAHVLAARELDEQCRALGLAPQAVVLAVGSGATLAGWLLGRRLLDARWRLEGIAVSRPATKARERVLALAEEAAPGVDVGDVVIHDGYLGAGYGMRTAAGDAAIRLAARSEGLFLDPTYTGKAMAGLADLARLGRFSSSAPLVFLHTGGEPALFAGAAW